MSAETDLVSNAPELYNIQALVAYIDAGHTIVTPNRRLSLHLLSSWEQLQQERGKSAWMAPRIMSLTDWLEERWRRFAESYPMIVDGRQRLSGMQSSQLWLQCVKQSKAGESLLRPDGAASLAARAYEHLLHWQVDVHAAGTRSQFHLSEDSATFLEWMDSFEATCTRRQLITAEQCAGILSCAVETLPLEHLLPFEFADLPPLYQQLMSREDIELHQHEIAPLSGDWVKVGCGSEEAEYYAAAHWAKGIVRANDSGAIRLGILVPDLGTQRNQVERIFTEVFEPEVLAITEEDHQSPLNFSVGETLDQVPAISIALTLLRLMDATIAMDSAISVLMTDYACHSTADYDDRVQLLSSLHDRLRDPVDTSDLRLLALREWGSEDAQAITFGKQLQVVWEDRRRFQQLTPGQWASYFWDTLLTLGWPGKNLSETRDEGPIRQFLQILENFSDWSSISDTSAMPAALGMLQAPLEQPQSQEKSPNAQVQILGRLEGAGLRFTHLWLSGLGAAHWPTPAAPNPFIPGTLQNKYELPHSSPAREYHFCEQLTERYRQSARELVFSYVNQSDGAGQVCSPLAAAAREVSLTELLGIEEQRLYYRYWSELRAQIACTEIQEVAAPIVDQVEHLKGGAGLLEAQANCGFRAFARYRLRARALAQVSPGLSAAERGTLVHQTLYLFWADVDSSQELLEMDAAALGTLISGACKDAVAELPGWRKRQLGENTLTIERDRLHILISRWLDYEKSRPTFAVVAREQGQQLEISGISLDLRIDRIDQIRDGGHLLIDYKTGAGSTRDWLGERPAKPQLPMYALANEETACAIALGLVTMDKPGMVGLAASAEATGLADVATFETSVDSPPEGSSWAAQMDNWRHRLENLFQQYVAGSALIDPLNPPTTCRYCDFAQVCRKHERDAQGGGIRG